MDIYTETTTYTQYFTIRGSSPVITSVRWLWNELVTPLSEDDYIELRDKVDTLLHKYLTLDMVIRVDGNAITQTYETDEDEYRKIQIVLSFSVETESTNDYDIEYSSEIRDTVYAMFLIKLHDMTGTTDRSPFEVSMKNLGQKFDNALQVAMQPFRMPEYDEVI